MNERGRNDALAIVHQDELGGGAFILKRGDDQVGELFYTKEGDVAVVEHTEVDPSLRGRGLGLALVEAAVAWARADGRTILPVCRFAKAIFSRRRDMHDVLAHA